MKKGIVTFCGHRTVDYGNDFVYRLREEILKLFFEYDFITFYLGANGAFDEEARLAIYDLKTELDLPCEIVLVAPYNKVNKDAFEMFEKVMHPQIDNVPPKYAIPRRNNWMVEQADVLIAYVWNKNGGAGTTYDYAKARCIKHGKPKVINVYRRY